MSNIGSNWSPSPLSSRNCRNSESNSTMRRSFNEISFGSRPNALVNPKNLNPPTPANTPTTTTTDHMKRNSITRKRGIIAPLDADPYVPPYDPKNNFLSPRPQYLRYKPNPRIKLLLNKEDYGKDDVTRLEDSFNLSASSLESEEQVGKNEAKLDDYVNGSSEDISEVGSEETNPDFEVVKASKPLSSHNSSEIVSEEKHHDFEVVKASKPLSSDDSSEIVSEEKQSDSMVKKASKPLFFTRTKTVSFIFVMFLVACFSLSFTESALIDLPIYNDIGFPDVYHESLKFAAFARQSFSGVVATDFFSYLSNQKSHLFPTQKTSPIQFFNLSASSIQENFLFYRRIGTDYIHDIHEYDEEMEDETEKIEDVYEEMEVDDEIDVVDEVVSEEELTEVQSDNDGAVESNPNLEDEFVSNSEAAQTETQSDGDSFVESKTNYKDETLSNSEVQTDIQTDVKEGYLANYGDDSQVLSSLLTISVNTVCLVVCSMVIAAASAIFCMKKAKSQTAKTTKVCIGEDNMCRDSGSAESSSAQNGAQNGYKKRANNNKLRYKTTSDFSMGSALYGSFITFEIILTKGDEVMLTPIRRSSRLLKK